LIKTHPCFWSQFLKWLPYLSTTEFKMPQLLDFLDFIKLSVSNLMFYVAECTIGLTVLPSTTYSIGQKFEATLLISTKINKI
jgi:hypothetical protein